MPYPNEHACRLADPSNFKSDTFVNMKSKDGKARLIMAKRPGSDKLELQAIRYPKDQWEKDAAKAECEKNNGTFEAAVEKSIFVEAIEELANKELVTINKELSLGEINNAISYALDIMYPPSSPPTAASVFAYPVDIYLSGVTIVRVSNNVGSGEKYIKYNWELDDQNKAILTNPIEVTKDWKEVGETPEEEQGITGEEKSIAKNMFVPITKSDDEKRIAYGVVLEPDTTDAQGDAQRPDEVEKACHNFLRKYNKQKAAMGYMHKRQAPEIEIVECAIAPADFMLNKQTVKKGSWYIGAYVGNNKIWKDIKDGRLTGFSIGGRGRAE